MSDRLTQRCSTCRKIKPLRAQYFDFKNVAEQTFHNVCRDCRAEERNRELENPQIPIENQYLESQRALIEQERLQLAVDKQLLIQAGLREMCLFNVEKILSFHNAGGSVPHAAEMVEAFSHIFGGPMGIAGQMACLYYDESTKQSERIRILEMINRTILKNTEMGGANKPADLMTDEDLAREREKVHTKLIELKVLSDTTKEVA